MPDDKAKPPKLRYEDAPALQETFADSISNWVFDGSVLRLEFTVTRYDERQGSEAQTGRRVPTCRLVLSTTAAVELLNRSRQFASALEKAGLLKRPAPKPSVTSG